MYPQMNYYWGENNIHSKNGSMYIIPRVCSL